MQMKPSFIKTETLFTDMEVFGIRLMKYNKTPDRHYLSTCVTKRRVKREKSAVAAP